MVIDWWMCVFLVITLLYLGISLGLVIARHIVTHPHSRFRDLLLTDSDD